MTLLASCFLATLFAAAQPATQQVQIEKLRVVLADRGAIHPRLLANAGRFKLLARQMRGGERARMAASVIQHAEAAAVQPPRHAPPTRADELRELGNSLGTLALAHKLTGRREFMAAAMDSIETVADWFERERWDPQPAGHVLLGQAIVYDWLYHDLDAAARNELRQSLLKQGGRLYGLVTGPGNASPPEHHDHGLWIDATGLLACGLAVYEQADEVFAWIAWARSTFRNILTSLGPDGATDDSVGYWTGGLEALVTYLSLERELLVHDRFSQKWLRNTGDYCLYASLPDGTPFAALADIPGAPWHGGTAALRWLAREYRVGTWQWMGDLVSGIAGRDSWRDLLWYDPSVRAKQPQTLPLGRWFEDLGIVFGRSDWNADATHVQFDCGPPLGHFAARRGARVPGRSLHRTVNALTVTCGPDRLWDAPAPGAHGILLVNGRGQVTPTGATSDRDDGEIAIAEPVIIKAQFGTEYDWYAADGAAAYALDAGLERFVRHVLLIRPDVVVVVDDLRAGSPAQFELRYPLRGRLLAAGESYRLGSGRTTAALHAWSTVSVAERVTKRETTADQAPLLSFTSEDPVPAAVVVVAIEILPPGSAKPARISAGVTADRLELSITRGPEARTLSLDLLR
jgi:hypothetical protein